ncbi:hypothetical protein AbraIFM66951_004087 [Aspergillus brasiliensis]|uniref:Major facilitator superfamily (MFS) profile domain-containing protein n=1 Tax=Aspergillus brasiliensis TaxID=319629 RepID=A0A9W5YNM6_9EURO|nr:hypothetical protein AbraCBS73388_006447 [Aspergillus brasiliensis]GKZ50723.1 hypothetical protein AbraIFM66951_004087 [Aspergillus brasiliensis]
METIRDSAFGKLVRFLSGYRLLLYPEELDNVTWRKYLRTPEVNEEEGLTLIRGEDFYDQHSLYTVMSQATRRRRQRPPLRSVLAGPWHGVKEVSPEAIGWGGPDDSENPQNWSITKKMLVTLLICLLTFSIYIGSAIYTPGVPGVARQFGVSNVVALLGLTLFVFGYGLELPAVGRSPIYVMTLVVFVFFQFAVIYAKNIGMLLAFRFLTGFLGSPVLATGGASIGDMWNPRVRDYMIAIWASFAIAAPVLGPLVGGFAASAKGWTWTIWELLWVSGFTLVLLFFFLPETFAPNILSRRARRIRRIVNDQRYASESEIEISQVASRGTLVLIDPK